MNPRELHTWELDTRQARALQGELATQVDITSPLPPWSTVAAADISYNKHDEWLFAAVVVVRAGSFEVIERAEVVRKATFPYVPGLLSFREAPAVLDAFDKLRCRPDVVLCDGQGYAHPRRIGLASHLGLWLDLPTIGCAKSWLCGEYVDPGIERGDRSPLIDEGEVIGAVVRTRARVKPLFVSSGHKCDLASAIAVVLAMCDKYRLPVPSRMAHNYVNELRLAAQPKAPESLEVEE